MTILLFLFFLGLLILAHELGHFLAAKRFGGIVEEFAIGFPPRIFVRKIKDTVYSLGLIIFGGFVKLRGDDNPNDPEGFLNLPAKNRLIIVLAGIIFNVILAYLLFSLSLVIGYPRESEKIFVSGFLNKNSQAANIFQVGDQIVRVRSEGSDYSFNNVQELAKFLREKKGQKIEIFYVREGELRVTTVVPPVGFYLGNFTLYRTSFPYNLYYALEETLLNFYKIVKGFFILIKNILLRESVNLEVVGPVGIYGLFDNVKQFGLGYVLYFIAVLSLNLAFINIFPFPALDGGRLIFILAEMVRGKKVDYLKEEAIHRVGFVLLFALLIFITIKDFIRLLK
ncbi:MAG: site-2 protease family protein [Patescibacteria group bacterium]|nr:site-2 protease family protein [Patescibacteria group bacterium]